MWRSYVLAFFLTIFVSGCSSVSVYKNDSITAYGGSGVDGRGEEVFYLIKIDMDSMPLTVADQIVLSLNEQFQVSLSQLTFELVSQTMPAWEPPKQWPEYVKQKTFDENRKRGIEDFAVEGTYIAFKNRRLWQISLCSHCEGNRHITAALSRKGLLAQYRLPLSEDQLREIFGEAKSITTQNEIYY